MTTKTIFEGKYMTEVIIALCGVLWFASAHRFKAIYEKILLAFDIACHIVFDDI